MQQYSEQLANVPMSIKFPEAKKVGKNWMMLCPFHSEKTPSLSVSEEGLYKCFACGESGNYFSFLVKARGLSKREALMEIENMTGVKLLHNDSPEQERFFEMNENTTSFYESELQKNESAAKKYLISRGISEESIKKFRIGYAPLKGNLLFEELKKKGFSVEEIRKNGLLKPYRDQDFFSGRIIFPIIRNGKVYGFAARIFSQKQGSQSKYINSPETAFFKKSCLLYEGPQEKNDNRFILVVEGYTDVIAMHQAGYSTVGLMGTTLSDKQIEYIKAQTKTVIIFLDPDEAGAKATIKAVKKLIEAGVEVKVISSDCDPADLIAKGGDIKEAIEKAQHGAVYLLQKLQHEVERQELIYTLAQQSSLPIFLSSLNESERYLFHEISAKAILESFREQMQLLVKVKNINIETRAFGDTLIMFKDKKMIASKAIKSNAAKKAEAIKFTKDVLKGGGGR